MAQVFIACHESHPNKAAHLYSEKFIVVPSGRFEMGWPKSDPEGYQKSATPRHEVALSTFTMSRDVVPVDSFCEFLNEADLAESFIHHNCEYSDRIRRQNGKFVPLEDKCKYWPMMSVSWVMAVAYCDWRTSLDSEYRYRLPTEAEWEYVASNGGITQFPWQVHTNKLSDHDVLLYDGQYLFEFPVGAKTILANEDGIRDLVGSVDQWCFDYFDSSYYGTSPKDNPTGPATYRARFSPAEIQASRVLRGGISVAPDTGGESILPRAYSRWQYQESGGLRPNPEMRLGIRLVREKK